MMTCEVTVHFSDSGIAATHQDPFFFFLRFYLFLQRGKGSEKEREEQRERERHQCMVTSHTRPTWDLAHNPDMCPDWELNQQPFGLQAGTQSTKPYQPGQGLFFFFRKGIYNTGILIDLSTCIYHNSFMNIFLLS